MIKFIIIIVFEKNLDCSQSPIFPFDRRDRAQTAAIFVFKQRARTGESEEITEWVGQVRRFRREKSKYYSKIYFSRRNFHSPHPLSSFVAFALPSSRSLFKNKDGGILCSISMIKRENRGLWTVLKRWL